jgi:acetylornithine deacetylase/succinyl-diaminopimelate desuccinylase-like protein
MQVEVVRLEGRTPLIYIEIPAADGDDCVLLYGHLDKQPEMTGWDDDLGPWKPVLAATSCTAAAAPTTATRSTAR